jgi:hypothetical protein
MRRKGPWAAASVALLLGVVGALAAGSGFADNESAARARCSEATLDGTYLFAEDGSVVTGNDRVPFALAGYELYNGNGRVRGVQSANFGGDVVRGERFTGTYTVERIAQPPSPITVVSLSCSICS